MRTTIRLDDQLFRDVKKLAAERGVTLTAVIEDALRETVARREATTPAIRRVELPTVPGGPRPGIDLDSSAALLDLMEEGERWS